MLQTVGKSSTSHKKVYDDEMSKVKIEFYDEHSRWIQKKWKFFRFQLWFLIQVNCIALDY